MSFLGSCGSSDGARLLLEFSDDSLASNAGRTRVQIYAGTCQTRGARLYSDDVPIGGQATARPPQLESGNYAIVADVWNSECAYVGTGCTETFIDGQAQDVVVSINAMQAATQCVPTLCTEGYCRDLTEEGDPLPTKNCNNEGCSISGRVFEDVDYQGGASTGYGFNDRVFPNASVELYRDGELIGSTATDPNGNYEFSNQPAGEYTVRVVSRSLLAQSNALAEQVYENEGIVRGAYVVGNGRSGALGGNDPRMSDASTAERQGVGDTNTTVTLADGDRFGVDFGFSFNAIVNSGDSGQGSLRQFMINANELDGPNRSVITIPDGNYLDLPIDPAFLDDSNGYAAPFIVINTPLPALIDDDTVLTGSAQKEFVISPTITFDQNPAAPEIEIPVGIRATYTATNPILDIRGSSVEVDSIAIVGNGQSGSDRTSVGVNVDAEQSVNLRNFSVEKVTLGMQIKRGNEHRIRDAFLAAASRTPNDETQMAIVEGSRHQLSNLHEGNNYNSYGVTFNNCVLCELDGFYPVPDYLSRAFTTLLVHSSTVSLSNLHLDGYNEGLRVSGSSNAKVFQSEIADYDNAIVVTNANAVVEVEQTLCTRYQSRTSAPSICIDLGDDGATPAPSDLRFPEAPTLDSATTDAGMIRVIGQSQPGAKLGFYAARYDDTYGEWRHQVFESYITQIVEGSSDDSDSGVGTAGRNRSTCSSRYRRHPHRLAPFGSQPPCHPQTVPVLPSFRVFVSIAYAIRRSETRPKRRTTNDEPRITFDGRNHRLSPTPISCIVADQRSSSMESQRGDLKFRTIPNMLRMRAAEFGDDVAIVDGDVRLSVTELYEQVKRGTASLVAMGIEPGERVAIWAPNLWEWIVVALSVHAVGGVVVPINTRYKGIEAAYLLQKSGAKALFTVTDFLDTNYESYCAPRIKIAPRLNIQWCSAGRFRTTKSLGMRS
ncbi:MAG: AMP-binding protein [Polyangiales bacterium]